MKQFQGIFVYTHNMQLYFTTVEKTSYIEQIKNGEKVTKITAQTQTG